MSKHTIDLDFDPHALCSQVFERLGHEYHRSLPRPDPQFAVADVAQQLGVKAATVRDYFDLPKTHPRHLPYIDTTGTPRGYRVRLSAITAWQDRNDSDAVPLELPVHRPARRQAA